MEELPWMLCRWEKQNFLIGLEPGAKHIYVCVCVYDFLTEKNILICISLYFSGAVYLPEWGMWSFEHKILIVSLGMFQVAAITPC